jgi:hypothetical protein
MSMTSKFQFVGLLVAAVSCCGVSLAVHAAEPGLSVKPGRGASNIKIERDEGAVVINVMSAGGIGQLTVQNGGQPWPMAMKLRLRYNANRPFTDLEGLTLSDAKSQLHTFLGSDSVEVSSAEGKTLSEAAKPEFRVLKASGTIEVTLPVAWLADKKEFHLHWVDFYRG